MNIPSRSMRSKLFAWLLVLLPGLAAAHGLLLDARHVGDKIEGTVYYSNGELAVGESVELLDLSTSNATAVAGETDAAGKFSFPATDGHRYRVSAYASEGHGVDIEIDAVANARPQLIEKQSAAEESTWMPPAWAVIGFLLLASLVPVVITRRRSGADR